MQSKYPKNGLFSQNADKKYFCLFIAANFIASIKKIGTRLYRIE
jgi:hypothetical protein